MELPTYASHRRNNASMTEYVSLLCTWYSTEDAETNLIVNHAHGYNSIRLDAATCRALAADLLAEAERLESITVNA